MQLRETDILDAVDALVIRTDVVEALTELIERFARLFDVLCAGVLLADHRANLHVMAATSRVCRQLQQSELGDAQGPSLDCYASGRPVSAPNRGTLHQRWPRFVVHADQAGVAWVHALPIRVADTVLGSVGLFGAHPQLLSAADQRVATSLTRITALAVTSDHPFSRTPTQLRTALVSRTLVDRAAGHLCERLNVPAEAAMQLLRDHARTHGIALTELARRLVQEPEGTDILATLSTSRNAW